MSNNAFRWTDASPAGFVTIRVDGVKKPVPADRSLLAGLLVTDPGGSAPEFFCGIGQCQRCLVRINGLEDIACLAFPRAGDEVETAPRWGGGRLTGAAH